MPSITTSDGVRLDYTESGAPTGRPVVLVAGFLAPATSWRYQVEALAGAGFRVVAVDMRGHGTSEKPAFGNTMARRAEDLQNLLEALSLKSVVLVGGSMGGNTIWAYLEAFGAARVAQVVIVDQTPKMLNSADWALGFYGYTEANRDTLFAAGVPETGHGTPMLKRGLRLVRMLRAMDLGAAVLKPSTFAPTERTPGELEMLHDHAVADWRAVIASQSVPILFVAGRESEVWPCGHAAASAALTPAATSLVIEKAGHATNMEQPRAFNAAVLSFLG